jgi:hypothetical protein
MGSFRTLTQVHGSRFGERVPAADAIAAPQPEQELSLPDRVIPLLTAAELRPQTAEQQKELSYLIMARHELNERTKVYLKVKLAEAQEDRERAWEAAKEAVCIQERAIKKLREKRAADEQETIRAQNALTVCQGRELAAEQALRELSRYSSQKDVDTMKRRIETATEKVRAAEREAADCVTQLNTLNLVTLKRAFDKLEELKAEEERLRGLATGTGYTFLGMQIPRGM